MTRRVRTKDSYRSLSWRRSVILLVLLELSMNVSAQKVTKSVDDMLRGFYDTIRTEQVPTGRKEFKFGEKSVIVYGTRHNRRDMNDPQYVEMGGLITTGRPSLILTEGNSYASADPQEAVRFGGEAAFCRYLAYQEGIAISSWDPYWGEVYYEMVKKYKAEDIFIVFLGDLFDLYRPANRADFAPFYRSFIVMLEGLGYPVQSVQHDPDHFLQQYKDRYGISFYDRDTPEGRAQLIRKRQLGADKAIMDRFAAIRDKRLVETIREAFKTHDKIFVQAGCVHRAAMEQVLVNSLSNTGQESDSALPEVFRGSGIALDPRWSIAGSFSKETRVGKKLLILWASDENIDRSIDKVSSQMENVIKKRSPTLILTEDYQKMDSDRVATYKKYGEGAIIRSIAQEKGTPLLAWGRYVSYPYYELRSQYGEQTVLNAILFFYLNKELRNYRLTIDTFQGYYNAVAGQLETDGFPRRYDQANFAEVLKRCQQQLLELPENTLLSDLDPIVNSAKISPVIGAFKKDRANDIINAIEKGLRYHDRIFLQADKEILKVLFGIGQHHN